MGKLVLHMLPQSHKFVVLYVPESLVYFSYLLLADVRTQWLLTYQTHQ